jgi:DNA-binding transcriptional ArsR family regulator
VYAESATVTRQLDRTFHALADRTRRQILRQLSRGPATVGEVATRFEISLPAVSQHLTVLERAGLISRTAEGRLRHCSLELQSLKELDDWIEPLRAYWTTTLAGIGEYADRKGVRR